LNANRICWSGRALLCVVTALIIAACGGAGQPAMQELQRTRTGMVDVVLLSPAAGLTQGKNALVLEFRAGDGTLLDVGTVRVNATMPMPGMSPMLAATEVHPAEVKGRYALDGDFSMAGTWRITVDWNGAAGRGAASLSGSVR
jgi:hypothetical protein